MNTKLLRKVAAKILAEPKQFDMDNYFASASCLGREVPNCGTAACIAGWSICLARRIKPSKAAISSGSSYSIAAMKVLKIRWIAAGRLFGVLSWPSEFRDSYLAHKDGSVGRARVAATRIEHFIKTKGRE